MLKLVKHFLLLLVGQSKSNNHNYENVQLSSESKQQNLNIFTFIFTRHYTHHETAFINANHMLTIKQ